MKVLVDINVFEDIFRQQTGWEASLGIVASVANGRAVGYVSVDAIVTRNKKHFRQLRIPVFDPEQALAAMNKA